MIGRLLSYVKTALGLEKRGKHPKDPALATLFGNGQEAASGVRVNENTAIAVTTVYACIRVLAETMAIIPAQIYRKLPDGGRELALDHPLQSVLEQAACPEISAFTFKELFMTHLGLRGNAIAYKQLNNAGRVIELWPIRPDRVIPFRREGRLYYMILIPPTNSSGWGASLDPWPFEAYTTVTLPAELIYHMKGTSFDGVTGLAPIDLMREAIGLALATEGYGARHFGNSSRPGGVLTHPGTLTDEAARRIRDSFERVHQGLDNAHKLAVLEEGMKFQQMALAPEASQFLQTRIFQLEEIARWYRVPPHMVGHLKNNSYATAEQLALEFASYTMAPWCNRWAQEVTRQLFTESDRRQYTVEYDLERVKLGDSRARGEFYHQARQSGWMCVDEIRRREGLNPLPDGKGKIFLSPLNMVPAGQETFDVRDPQVGGKSPAPEPGEAVVSGAPAGSPPPAQKPGASPAAPPASKEPGKPAGEA